MLNKQNRWYTYLYRSLLGFIALMFSGCSSQSIDFYQQHAKERKYPLDLRQFFQGDIEGWGALFDWSGRQTRSFYVQIKASWQGNQGVLDEWFTFDDGEKVYRQWKVDYRDDQTFEARAGDVVGVAQGLTAANAVNMNYVLRLPYKDSTIDVSMDDWMYQVEDGVVLNKTAMKKWGFKVGEVALIMKKKSGIAQGQSTQQSPQQLIKP
jgi:hypothetical protein